MWTAQLTRWEEGGKWIEVKYKKLPKTSKLYNTSHLPPSQPSSIIRKGDSAASNHYRDLCDSMILDYLSEHNYGTSVTLPDKSTITSIKKGKLTNDG